MRDTIRLQASDDLKATVDQIEAVEAQIAAYSTDTDAAALGSLRTQLEALDHRRRNIQRFIDMRDARIGWLESTGQVETEKAPEAASERPMVRRPVFGMSLG